MANIVPYMGQPGQRAPGRGEGPDRVRAYADSQKHGSKKPKDKPGEQLVRRRHPLWNEHQIRWRELLDSYEGGQRYRNADYGVDRRGLPLRNLVRHRREYPDPQANPNIYQGFGNWLGSVNTATMVGLGTYPGMLGASSLATAWDDDFEMRRARTPVPEWVANAIWIHLGKIYDQSVSRDGPDEVKEWWRDVNNSGVPIDDWMREVVAPLLMVLGCIDIVCDRPRLPDGVEVVSQADEQLYGLDRVCASIILPENMLWWANDNAGGYTECLVREYMDLSKASLEGGMSDGTVPEFADGQQWIHDSAVYRHWTQDDWTLYAGDGEQLTKSTQHGYGFVPIRRFIDLLRHRTPMVGKSRYEAIMEYQREYYNRSSELILSDTLQAHPFLSGPADYCKADNTLSIGPGYVLPMKEHQESGTYQGWEFVSPPKDPAESLRKNMQGLRDEADRHASLTKPAGTPGTTGGTVAQSGLSKELDAHSGNKQLSDIAKSLAKFERQLAEFAEACRTKKRLLPLPTRQAIKVTYPARFQLKTTNELLNDLGLLLQSNAQANGCPIPPVAQAPAENEAAPAPIDPVAMKAQMVMPQVTPTLVAELFVDIAHSILVGREATITDQIKDEIQSFFKVATLVTPGIDDDSEALEGAGTAEAQAGTDPTGESGATLVSAGSPVQV